MDANRCSSIHKQHQLLTISLTRPNFCINQMCTLTLLHFFLHYQVYIILHTCSFSTYYKIVKLCSYSSIITYMHRQFHISTLHNICIVWEIHHDILPITCICRAIYIITIYIIMKPVINFHTVKSLTGHENVTMSPFFCSCNSQERQSQSCSS